METPNSKETVIAFSAVPPIYGRNAAAAASLIPHPPNVTGIAAKSRMAGTKRKQSNNIILIDMPI